LSDKILELVKNEDLEEDHIKKVKKIASLLALNE